jgi:hypothetical protein
LEGGLVFLVQALLVELEEVCRIPRVNEPRAARARIDRPSHLAASLFRNLPV